ncbi:MAG: cytochrome c family protein [Desulfotignum sp.]|nr:cytochrome c family protein [Desulfotignum sp.]
MQTGTIRKKHNKPTGWFCTLLTAGYIFLAPALLLVSLADAAPATDSTWFVEMNQYSGAAHGSLRCEDCHGPMIESESGIKKPHPDPDDDAFLKSQTKRIFDYQSCRKCHKTAYSRFLKGAHAKAADKEKTTGSVSLTGYAPVCGDCHSAHYSKSHLSRVQTGRIMTQTCGTCHPDQKTSYLSNYHGKAAVNLGHDKSAFCTDCHGAHTTFSLKDNEAALNACLRCHPDATPEFANIIIHDTKKNIALKNDAKKTGLKWVHGVRAVIIFFVVLVLVFFYSHTGLLMLRKLHEKLRRHK